jgi:hypothetical protein
MVMNHKQRSRKNMRPGSKKRSGHGRKHFTKRVQQGGVSPACLLDGATSTSLLVRNPSVNLHNTNPQASLDLDNKFMAYGSPIPLANNVLQGGAGKCGDEGVGTGHGKSETFKQYLEGLSNQYNLVGGNDPGNNRMETNSNAAPMNTNESEDPLPPTNKMDDLRLDSNMAPMEGGGYTTDPSEFIAGLPVYKAYDDCCPPVLISGDLKFGAPDQPVCGLGAIKGGARRRRSGSKHKKSRRVTKKANSRKRHHNKKHSQKGGDFRSPFNSAPAPYSEAFNGPPGVFKYPDDMKTRAFDEKQPNYTPNAI